MQQGGNLEDAFALMEPEVEELRKALCLGCSSGIEITCHVSDRSLNEEIKSSSVLECLPREVPDHSLYPSALAKAFIIFQYDRLLPEEEYRLFELIFAASPSSSLCHPGPPPRRSVGIETLIPALSSSVRSTLIPLGPSQC
jgi:hypothetical protein